MENYLKHATPPKEALKIIQAGRLKGKSDINPQWRLEALTDLFGPVGIGWYTEITRREYIEGANGEVACFVDINLYYKADGEWSKPVVGTGGSMFVANERNGLYTSDEVEKMAYTDAISVAAKAIGIASNVYRGLIDTKYTKPELLTKEAVLRRVPLCKSIETLNSVWAETKDREDADVIKAFKERRAALTPKVVIKESTKEFKSVLDWLLEKEGRSIETLKKKYDISADVEKSLLTAVQAAQNGNQ